MSKRRTEVMTAKLTVTV